MSKKEATPTRQRYADDELSRNRILDAAAEIAAERGYEGTSIAAVSAKCGLPASSIYEHFKNKDDLIAAAIEHSSANWPASWKEPVRQPQIAQGSSREKMATYRTIVVGTDGSETSLRAVHQAAVIAAKSDAKLIIALPYRRDPANMSAAWQADVLKGDGYQMRGIAPIYAILREASERAKSAGATNIEERPIRKAPEKALIKLAQEVNADLLVVDNVGLNSFMGRWLSLAGHVSHKAKTEVLAVNTTGRPGPGHDANPQAFPKRHQGASRDSLKRRLTDAARVAALQQQPMKAAGLVLLSVLLWTPMDFYD